MAKLENMGSNFSETLFSISSHEMGEWRDQTFCVFDRPRLVAQTYMLPNMLDFDSDSLTFDDFLFFPQKCPKFLKGNPIFYFKGRKDKVKILEYLDSPRAESFP